ncbi:hypothetical protein ACWKSP_34315 [Micromonosporaceae bacterium Da 78-11]
MRKSRTTTGFRPLRAGIAVAATAAAVVAGTAMPAFAGATLTLSPSQVNSAGGTVLYITGGTALVNDLGVRFVPSATTCPTLYGDTLATAVDAGQLKVVPSSSTTGYVTTPALTAGTAYKPCIYATTSAGATAYGTDTLSVSGTTTVTPVPFGTLSASTGLAAEKITLTAGSAIFSATGYGIQFVNNATLSCPSTYSTATSSIINGTTAKTSTSVLTVTVPTLVASTQYAVCAYSSTTVGSGLLTAKSSSTFANYGITTLPSVSLNPTGGSSGTATSLTLNAATGIFSGSAPAVLFTRNACPGTYAAGSTYFEPYAPTTSPAVSKISSTKIATTVPTSVIVGGADATTAWNVCAYASTSGDLIAVPATYSVAPVLAVASAQFATGSGSAANTLSGPAQGGQLITVSGLTGVPTKAAFAAGAKLTATLGGNPITNITPIDTTSFTGVTPAHGAGDVQLTVTTAAGSRTTTASSAGGTKYYTYTYGITVTPNTAASGTTPVLDITGAGFGNITTWADVTTATVAGAGAYVLLTNNLYYTQTFTSVTAFSDTKPPVSYCNGVLPISDTEIICTLNLTAMVDSVGTGGSAGQPVITTNDVPVGTYTVTVVNEGNDIDANEYSIVSSGSTFTVASF